MVVPQVKCPTHSSARHLFSLWWVIPLSLVLSGLLSTNSTLSGILVLWLFTAGAPITPATGIAAAVIGLFSRDRLVSFLFGILPGVVLAFLSLTRPLQGEDCFIACPGFVYIQLISTVGFGFGFMGLGGALYGEWEQEPPRTGQRTVRLGVLLGFLGLSLWLITVWGPIIFDMILR